MELMWMISLLIWMDLMFWKVRGCVCLPATKSSLEGCCWRSMMDEL